MLRRLGSWPVIGSLVVLVLALAPTAAADHTNPRTPLAPTNGTATTGLVRGEGTWQHARRCQVRHQRADTKRTHQKRHARRLATHP
jgi:hypothetical protein